MTLAHADVIAVQTVGELREVQTLGELRAEIAP